MVEGTMNTDAPITLKAPLTPEQKKTLGKAIQESMDNSPPAKMEVLPAPIAPLPSPVTQAIERYRESHALHAASVSTLELAREAMEKAERAEEWARKNATELYQAISHRIHEVHSLPDPPTASTNRFVETRPVVQSTATEWGRAG